MKEQFKAQITTAITILTPYVKEIIQEKIIPWAKKQYYKKLEKTMNKCFLKLTELGEKILTCTDAAKKTKHIVGFKLGYEFVKSLKIVVVKAEEVLTEINTKIFGEDLIGDDEIPF